MTEMKHRPFNWTTSTIISFSLFLFSGCATNITERNGLEKIALTSVAENARYPQYPAFNIRNQNDSLIRATVWVEWALTDATDELDFVAAKYAIDRGFKYITQADRRDEVCVDGCSKFLPSEADYQLSDKPISSKSKTVDTVFSLLDESFSISKN
jgi:hypothetical protein